MWDARDKAFLPFLQAREDHKEGRCQGGQTHVSLLPSPIMYNIRSTAVLLGPAAMLGVAC